MCSLLGIELHMWFYVEGSSAALSTSLSFPVLLFGKVLEKKRIEIIS